MSGWALGLSAPDPCVAALFCTYTCPPVSMEQRDPTGQGQDADLTVRTVCSILRKVVELPKPKPNCPDAEGAHLRALYEALVDLWARPFFSLLKSFHANMWFKETHAQFQDQLRSLVSQSVEIHNSLLSTEVKLRQLAHLLASSLLTVQDPIAAQLMERVSAQTIMSFDSFCKKLARKQYSRQACPRKHC